MNPILSLIITNIIWGAASPIFQFALQNIPPFTLAFIRFFFASFLFLPFIKKKDWLGLAKKDWWHIILGGIFGITINISFFFLGVQKTESINVPIIASSGPVFGFMGSILFLHEKPSKKVFVGMLISLMGALGIVFSPIIFNGQTMMKIGQLEGNLMIVLATIGSVVAPLITKNVLKKTSPVFVTFIGFLFSSLTFFPLASIELQKWSFGQLNNAGILGIIYGVFFSSAIAYFCLNYGLSKLQAQEIGLFTYIDPLAAMLVAVPLLKEYPDIPFVVSALFVLGGIFIAEGRIHYHPFHRLKISNHK